MSDDLRPLTADELAAEGATALPDKEVISLLDLNADLDLALDVAAPVDLAVAANANIAAPIDAAVAANVLSLDSSAAAVSDQSVLIDQGISGDATATAPQDSAIDSSSDGAVDSGTAAPAPAPAEGVTTGTGGLLDGNLLNVDVDLNADADVAAPIGAAVAANANVAAPIDAAVAANVGSIGSDAVAISDQDAVITQHLDDVSADATADQSSTITQ